MRLPAESEERVLTETLSETWKNVLHDLEISIRSTKTGWISSWLLHHQSKHITAYIYEDKHCKKMNGLIWSLSPDCWTKQRLRLI